MPFPFFLCLILLYSWNVGRNGSNTRGYFTWSFLDSFELLDGYDSGFGLYYVDLDDKELTRYPKKSAHWYSNFLKGRRTSTNESIEVEEVISTSFFNSRFSYWALPYSMCYAMPPGTFMYWDVAGEGRAWVSPFKSWSFFLRKMQFVQHDKFHPMETSDLYVDFALLSVIKR